MKFYPHYFCLPFFFLFSLIFLSCSHEIKLEHASGPTALSIGKADLSSFVFDNNTLVRLSGTWFFSKDTLLSVNEVRTAIASGSMGSVAVPSRWSRTGIFGSTKQLSKYGTLALELQLPVSNTEWAIRLPNADSACRLFVDTLDEISIGEVSDNPLTFRPNNGLGFIKFKTDTQKVLLVLQVANFATPYTGTWDSPVIGTICAIDKQRQNNIIFTTIISGALLFMGFYHLALYLLRRNDSSSLFFGILCLFMTIRHLIMGERLLLSIFPQTWYGWQIGFSVEHLSAHMVLPLFTLFLWTIFPKQIKKPVLFIILSISGIWTILEIFTPALFHHRFLPLFEYFIVIAAVYLMIVIIKAIIHGQKEASIIIVGFGLALATTINDVLLSNGIIESFYMSSLGIFFFTFSQSFLLSLRFCNLFTMVENYSHDLESLNHSLERFIPHEVLGFLNKKSILDVHLGDFSEQNMSVFFLDIRDFTHLAESLSPSDTFCFINKFLEVFGPIVPKYNGFIDKYLGDGFMALFPGDTENAFNAALEMRKKLVEFNTTQNTTADPIKFGIGIHSGTLMLGTIGEKQRMDSTVISDTVNTASRLEQLTKIYKTDILVSANSVEKLKNPAKFELKSIALEKLKGKDKITEVLALVR